MPKVVITHAVQDIDRWLQGKAERAASDRVGNRQQRDRLVAQDGSNNIAVTADVADPEAMKSMLAAPPARRRARRSVVHAGASPLPGRSLRGSPSARAPGRRDVR